PATPSLLRPLDALGAAAPGDKIFQRTAHSPAARTLSLENFPVGVPAVRACRPAGTFWKIRSFLLLSYRKAGGPSSIHGAPGGGAGEPRRKNSPYFTKKMPLFC